MSDILTLRQAAAILNIQSDSKKNPTRKVHRFLKAIQNTRKMQVLFQREQQYYTTLPALKNAIPELFIEENKLFQAPNEDEIKEDVSEETLEVIRELAQSLKEQMKQLRGRNKHLQDQLTTLSNKYQDLEGKYTTLVQKFCYPKQ